MKKQYDLERARTLIPLLDAITRELTERAHAVRALLRRVRQLQADDAEVDRILDCQAELANHRREIRFALEELERLGCVVDEGHPLAVMIPGEDGKFDHGFRWDAGDETVYELSADPLVG